MNQRNKTEAGRSFVEMLGTLAIMGVLSIGAIMGFNYAMNMGRANIIVNGVKARAYTCMTQFNLFGRNQCSLGEFEAAINGVWPTTVVPLNNGYFGIQVSDVNKPICERIKSMGFTMAGSILPEVCDDTNDMIFMINKYIEGETKYIPRKCTPATVAQDCPYRTMSPYTINATCSDSGFCDCPKNSTMTKVGCCPNDKILNGACCWYGIREKNGEQVCCSYSPEGHISNNDQCCPAGQMPWNGACHSCFEENTFNSQWDSYMTRCDACPNRVQAQMLCLLDCLEPDQVNVGGECHCPFERPIMIWNGPNAGKCVTCAEGGQARTFNVPLGYNFVDIARYCNYLEGGGYNRPCPMGTVGLSANKKEKYIEDGEIKTATGYSLCADCSQVETAILNSRARCESCGGSWTPDASVAGTQDEWSKGVCNR